MPGDRTLDVETMGVGELAQPIDGYGNKVSGGLIPSGSQHNTVGDDLLVSQVPANHVTDEIIPKMVTAISDDVRKILRFLLHHQECLLNIAARKAEEALIGIIPAHELGAVLLREPKEFEGEKGWQQSCILAYQIYLLAPLRLHRHEQVLGRLSQAVVPVVIRRDIRL